jgi:hypothetical protein
MAFSQSRSGAPGLAVGFRIDMNCKLGQIGKHTVAEIGSVPLAPYAYLQNVRDFQVPECRNPCRCLDQVLKNLVH